jgi:hypothetical protein
LAPLVEKAQKALAVRMREEQAGVRRNAAPNSTHYLQRIRMIDRPIAFAATGSDV